MPGRGTGKREVRLRILLLLEQRERIGMQGLIPGTGQVVV